MLNNFALIRNNSSESLNLNQDDITINSSANVVSITDVNTVEDTDTDAMTCGESVGVMASDFFIGSTLSVGTTLDSGMSTGGSLGSDLDVSSSVASVASVFEVNMDGVYPGIAATVQVIENIDAVRLYYGSK